MDHIRAAGLTLAYAPVRLDAYRDRPLDAALLLRLDEGWARARAAGIKLVLRFVYNDGPWPKADPDAPRARILEHLAQLAPALERGEDVIAVLQAGFIGAWGEWHDSHFGLDNPASRGAILRGILRALPASRMVQVRTPPFKRETLGGPLGPEEAFSGGDRARVGHHDDCFLASRDVACTEHEPVEAWRAHIVAEGLHVPVGGETCAVNPPETDAEHAMSEMAAWRFSFLNALYHPEVIAGWEAAGKLGVIRRRLGYRFRLTSATVRRHDTWVDVEARVTNDGFACLYNARPVWLVVGDERERLTADPRRWRPGEEVVLHARLHAPAGARVGLWLPDAAASLRERPEYAIRVDGAGWDAGVNVIAEGV
jgi:hypothetical protein